MQGGGSRDDHHRREGDGETRREVGGLEGGVSRTSARDKVRGDAAPPSGTTSYDEPVTYLRAICGRVLFHASLAQASVSSPPTSVPAITPHTVPMRGVTA